MTCLSFLCGRKLDSATRHSPELNDGKPQILYLNESGKTFEVVNIICQLSSIFFFSSLCKCLNTEILVLSTYLFCIDNPNKVELQTELSGVHNVNLYSYKKLRIATDDFSQTNKIGEGGFGSVYKVTKVSLSLFFLVWNHG